MNKKLNNEINEIEDNETNILMGDWCNCRNFILVPVAASYKHLKSVNLYGDMVLANSKRKNSVLSRVSLNTSSGGHIKKQVGGN